MTPRLPRVDCLKYQPSPPQTGPGAWSPVTVLTREWRQSIIIVLQDDQGFPVESPVTCPRQEDNSLSFCNPKREIPT